MQFGLPVVTTNEGAIADIVEDGKNGYISERKDAFSLAEGIGRLLDNSEKCGLMGQNNIEKYNNKYQIDSFENTLFAIINSVSG